MEVEGIRGRISSGSGTKDDEAKPPGRVGCRPYAYGVLSPDDG